MTTPPVWPAWLSSKEGGEPPVEPSRASLPSVDVRLADLATGGTGTMDAAIPREVIDSAMARAEAARVVPSVPPPPVTPWAVPAPLAALEATPAPRLPSWPPVAAVPAPSPPAVSRSTARSAQPAAPPREPPREHIDLLWYDPAAVPRILADEALGQGRPDRAGPRWVKEAAASREPPEAKERREILAIFSRARPVDEPAAFDQVVGSAYRDDGTFASPLVIVAGELSFDFDEVETLRAILTVITPFLGADKKLREVASGATEALKAEGRLPGDIAAGLTRRIEEAFAQGQRSVAAGYLDTSVERILLEGRRYAKKTLFGEPRLRALLAFPGGPAGGAASAAPLPAYLPEALATRLPLFRRFKARAIVELRPQEDQYETHPDALVVLALARVIRRGG